LAKNTNLVLEHQKSTLEFFIKKKKEWKSLKTCELIEIQ
jgi:hypothetical protein